MILPTQSLVHQALTDARALVRSGWSQTDACREVIARYPALGEDGCPVTPHEAALAIPGLQVALTELLLEDFYHGTDVGE